MPYLLLYKLIIISFLLLISCNTAQETQPSPKEPITTASLNTGNQIAKYITEIFEDSKGNLWFGTVEYGLVRYDGKQLTYFTTESGLCDNTIVDILEDSTGNIWVGTHKGIAKYDGSHFTHYPETIGYGGTLLLNSKGTLWAGTNDGLYCYNGRFFESVHIPYPAEAPYYKWEPGKIWHIMEDRSGNIWLAIDGCGTCKFDGENFTFLTEKDGLTSNNVSAIAEDNEGKIWIGTLSTDFPDYENNGGLNRIDNDTITQFPDVEGLYQNDIYTIYKDKAGNIWIGAIGTGLYQFDGHSFTLYTKINRPDLAGSFGVQSLLQDSKGNFWVGMSGGLFLLQDGMIINVTKTDLVN